MNSAMISVKQLRERSSAAVVPGRSARLPLTLLAILTPVLVLTLIYCPAGRLNWLLEVGPALLGFVALALVGAVAGLLLLGRMHDRSMAKRVGTGVAGTRRSFQEVR